MVGDPDDLEKLRAKSDRAVSIDGFIPNDAVDGLYCAGKTHYLLPDGVAGARPQALLRDGDAFPRRSDTRTLRPRTPAAAARPTGTAADRDAASRVHAEPAAAAARATSSNAPRWTIGAP